MKWSIGSMSNEKKIPPPRDLTENSLVTRRPTTPFINLEESVPNISLIDVDFGSGILWWGTSFVKGKDENIFGKSDVQKQTVRRVITETINGITLK